MSRQQRRSFYLRCAKERVVSSRHQVAKQHPGLCPIALHGSNCNAEGERDLLVGEATEEPALDDTGEPLVDQGETIECVVDSK